MEESYKEELKVRLYDDDLKRLGKQLAEENESLNTLETRKAEIASSLAAQIKAHKANIGEISAKINRGYELREVECTWLMETPRSGLKTLIRQDTGEEVRTDPMTQGDMQLGIDLKPAPDDFPPEEGKSHRA